MSDLTSGWRRFCKPLDGQLVRQMAKNHPVIITVEEGSIGGFGSHGGALMYLRDVPIGC